MAKEKESQYETSQHNTTHTLKANNHDSINENVACLKEQPIGITNVMSNCYINVILQCLANIPQFVYALYNYVKGKYGEIISCVDDEIDERFLKPNPFTNNSLSKNICSNLQYVVGSIKGEKVIISFTSKLVYLSRMYKDQQYLNLRKFLKLLSAEFFPDLKFSKHEDCQEFLIRFFEMTNNLIKIENSYINTKSDPEYAMSKDQSIIKGVFGGILEETITCGKCDYLNKIYQPFDILTINIIPQLTESDLNMTLEHFFRKELVKGTICGKCKSSPIYKETVFYKQPEVLILHIPRLIAQDTKLLTPIRFPFDHFSLENVLMRIENASADAINTMNKWNYNVYQKTDATLDNKGFIESPKKYYLIGLIEHIGIDGYGGHYICYNKRTHSDGMKRWYLFDDTKVFCVTQDVVKMAEPYCLFYSSC